MPKSPKGTLTTGKLPPPAGNEVDAYLQALDHPLRDDIARVRGWVLEAAPGITEAVKWNAPSFATTEFFATFHLRSRDEVQVVFHTGAKVRAAARPVVLRPRSSSLVTWLSDDRAMVSMRPQVLPARKAAFMGLVREWVAQL